MEILSKVREIWPKAMEILSKCIDQGHWNCTLGRKCTQWHVNLTRSMEIPLKVLESSSQGYDKSIQGHRKSTQGTEIHQKGIENSAITLLSRVAIDL